MRARPEEMRCVGSKRTRELGRDMLLAASIVKFSVPKAHGRKKRKFFSRKRKCVEWKDAVRKIEVLSWKWGTDLRWRPDQPDNRN